MNQSGGEHAAASLHLATALRARILKRATSIHPDEACGLLVGFARDGDRHVVRALALPNRSHRDRRRHFRIAPRDLVRLTAAARGQGLDVIGVWHSHPDGAPTPSDEDRRRAIPGWSYLILGRDRRGAPSLASWTIDADGAFAAERMIAAS